jgi:hypothetical protein
MLHILVFLISSCFSSVLALPASLQFQDCFSGNVAMKLNISTVYAQILNSPQMGTYMNLTVFGNSSEDIMGYSNQSTSLGKSPYDVTMTHC